VRAENAIQWPAVKLGINGMMSLCEVKKAGALFISRETPWHSYKYEFISSQETDEKASFILVLQEWI
jgi:hypothetical protein